jgi:hypothetical protein
MKKILIITTVMASIVAVGLGSVWLLTRVWHGRVGGTPTQTPRHQKIADNSVPVHSQSAGSPGSATSGATASNTNLIAEICGTNAWQWLQHLRSAGPLSGSDCETLCRFLQEKTTDERLERVASIKNTVMDILARQPNLPIPWETTLRQILEDEGQHRVIRDYALQHLFSRYEDMPDRPQRKELEILFRRMLERTQESFAGTSLLGLYDLSAKGLGVDAVRLGRSAVDLLQHSDASPLARIPAFQVCALLGEREVLPEALRTAKQGETVALRCSAIAAIGALGKQENLGALQAFTDESNPSIRLAIRAAMKRIETKTNG